MDGGYEEGRYHNNHHSQTQIVLEVQEGVEGRLSCSHKIAHPSGQSDVLPELCSKNCSIA